MATITDEFMKQMISKTRPYCVVILKAGPNRNMDGVDELIWAHGRRNFLLRADGLLPIVLPVSDGSSISGVGVFNTSIEAAIQLMDDDPAVKKGVFVYEIHQCRSFAGDCLPE
jgi:hypothetical protein